MEIRFNLIQFNTSHQFAIQDHNSVDRNNFEVLQEKKPLEVVDLSANNRNLMENKNHEQKLLITRSRLPSISPETA